MLARLSLGKIPGTLLLVLFLTLSQLNSFAQAADDGHALEWYSDFEAAKSEAGSNGKYLMLYFSGSDWCKPCIQLNRNILETETFSQYARGNFVPVKLDFPKMRKNKLSKKKVIHNEDLAEKYNPNGVFPLLVFLDKNEKVIGFTGFTDVSPNAYVIIIDKIIRR
ncbi:MAG: thioredoxin family protein [Cytophagales bacterium]|nr:thioredoxin family protein [Cytophagales bacterium]